MCDMNQHIKTSRGAVEAQITPRQVGVKRLLREAGAGDGGWRGKNEARMVMHARLLAKEGWESFSARMAQWWREAGVAEEGEEETAEETTEDEEDDHMYRRPAAKRKQEL